MSNKNNNPNSEVFETLDSSELFEYAAIGLAYINLKGRILQANPAFRNHLGYQEKSLNTLQLDEIVHPNDRDKLSAELDELMNQVRTTSTLDLRCFNAAGETSKVRLMLSVICNKQGSVRYFIAALEDLSISTDGGYGTLSDRKLFETIAEYVPTTVWLASTDMKNLYYANQAFMDTWKITKEQLVTGATFNILDRIHPDDAENVRQRIRAGFVESDAWEQSFRIINDDNSVSFIDDYGTVLRNQDGDPVYLLGTHNDVTERVRYTSQLESLNQELQIAYETVTRLNQFDTLTGCYNRSALLDHLSNAYYQYTRYDIPSCILYIDLNNFKSVNDNYGHNTGDKVLKSFVTHMQARLRQTDILGRMGGDEFLLLLPGTNKHHAEQFLKTEKAEFTTQIESGRELTLSYAVGLSELDLKIKTIDEWVDAADKLMYQGKPK